MAFQSPDSELIYELDLLFSPTGTLGYVIPLDAVLAINKPFTADAPSNVITFAATQKFKTGSRVRVSSSNTLPTPLTAGGDYFLHRLTSTTFKVCATLDDAIAGTEINLMDAGAGTLNANEQNLLRTDPIDVLLTHEFAAGVLAVPRLIVADVGVATIVSGKAQKQSMVTVQNSSVDDVTIGYFLFTRGGTAAIGNIPPGYKVEVLTAPFTLPAGDSKLYNLKLQKPNI